MAKKMRKLITLCIALAMCISAMTVTAFADDGTHLYQGEGLENADLSVKIGDDTYTFTPQGGHWESDSSIRLDIGKGESTNVIISQGDNNYYAS